MGTIRALLFHSLLEDTARYAGLLLAPTEGFGRGRGFFTLRAKKELLTLFVPILSHLWCSEVTPVIFISKLSNFEKNQKNPKNPKKNPKQIQENPKKIHKKYQKSKKL